MITLEVAVVSQFSFNLQQFKMAKKKSPIQAMKKKPAEKWNGDETTTLYSWLDYCVLTLEKDKEYFWNTIHIRLKELGSTHSDPTQIKRKLKTDWLNSRSHGFVFDDIYKTGSTHFAFDEEKIRKIEIAHRQWREKPAYQSHHLRSGSKLDRFRSLSCSSFKPSENGDLTIPKRLAGGRTTSSSMTPSAARHEIEPIGVLSEEVLPSRKRKRKVGNKLNSIHVQIYSLETKLIHPCYFSQTPTKSYARKKTSKIQHIPSRSVTIVDDSEEDETSRLSSSGNQPTTLLQDDNPESRSTENGEFEVETSHPELQSETCSRYSRCVPTCNLKLQITGVRHAEVCCTMCKTWQHNSCVGLDAIEGMSGDYLCDKCDFGGYQQRLNDFNLQQMQRKTVELRLSTAIEEIQGLKHQLRQKETNLQDIQEEIVQLEETLSMQKSAQFQRDQFPRDIHGCRAFEELIQQREGYIKTLQRELNDRRRLGQFTTLPEKCREWFGIGLGSEGGIPSVYTEIKQFALSLKHHEPFIQTSLEQHPDLGLLVNEILNPEQDKPEASSMEHIRRLSVQGAMRSLVICALRLWVFEENFDSDTASEKSSELLAKYRECIGKQGRLLYVCQVQADVSK
jgi:hypothetical protein